MEMTIPLDAKTVRDTLKKPQGDMPAAGVARLPIVPRRPLRGLFRRSAPTTYQRCLAVHMHFAQHPSALD